MKVEDFTDLELQKMRLVVKKVDRLALYFEGPKDENLNYINNVTLPPVTYVRKLPLDVIATLVLVEGYPVASTKLGVSESFLKNEIVKRIRSNGSLTCKEEPLMTEECVRDIIKRVPFGTLLESLTGWKKFDLKRLMRNIRLEENSNLNTARGRRAEIFYRDFRGEKILKDLNETVAQSDYDFDDEEYARVNVKSAKLVRTKTKGGRWYFPLKKDGKCDNYVLVCYNELGDIPVSMILVSMEEVGKKSLIVKEGVDDEVGVLLWKRA